MAGSIPIGTPRSSRVICAGSPGKTHHLTTWIPASRTWAKAAERVGIFVETPPVLPLVALQPKSHPQLYQGTFTPCRYQLVPFQAIRSSGAFDADNTGVLDTIGMGNAGGDTNNICPRITPPSRTTATKKANRRFAISFPVV